jgi:hypothetical protein
MSLDDEGWGWNRGLNNNCNDHDHHHLMERSFFHVVDPLWILVSSSKARCKSGELRLAEKCANGILLPCVQQQHLF